MFLLFEAKIQTNSHELLNVSSAKQRAPSAPGRQHRCTRGELKMNESARALCSHRAQSAFMYVGRGVFDEIVASARLCNPIYDRARARERLISPRCNRLAESDSIEFAFGCANIAQLGRRSCRVKRNRTAKSIGERTLSSLPPPSFPGTMRLIIISVTADFKSMSIVRQICMNYPDRTSCMHAAIGRTSERLKNIGIALRKTV